MLKGQWIVFLQLLVSFLNLLLLLVSFSTILKIKDEVDALKLKDFACSVGPFKKNVPHTLLHTVSKQSSVSNDLLNHEHIEFEANTVNSISLDSSIKYADYLHKDSRFRDTQLKNYFSGKRKRLKIGVPMKSSFKQYVGASNDGKSVSGFSIDVFRAAVNLIPAKIMYQIVPFNGSSDELLKRVALKTFDAAVGDIMIKAEGYQFLEFSHPYVEARLSMVVKTIVDKSQPWLFFTLFTPWMWFTMAAMTIFTSSVIWFIEHQHNEQLDDSPAKSIVPVLWISLATLYWGNRETPNNCLSHFVLGPWLLLMLVVSATFTSSLTSVLTNSNSAPSLKMDVNELKRTNSLIGTDGSLYVDQYLVKVLGFKQRNIRSMSSTNEYEKALSTGAVKAVFILTPYAKIFLAKYCKRFAVAGPTYKLGSFGFVFQKGSALALDMSQAILRLSESGELQIMEEQMMSSFNCSISPSDAKVTQSLGPEPFLGFFVISGGASAIALLITLIGQFRRSSDSFIQSGFMGGRVWPYLFILFSPFQRRTELQPMRNSSTQPQRRLVGTDMLNRLIISILQNDLQHSINRDED